MKSAFLVARHGGLIAEVVAEAQEWARCDSEWEVDPCIDLVRISKQGAGTMLIERLDGVAEWEWREPIDGAGIQGPLSGFLISCRSEDFFCVVVRALAARLGVELWVVDSEGSVFSAASVRPDLVRL